MTLSVWPEPTGARVRFIPKKFLNYVWVELKNQDLSFWDDYKLSFSTPI